MPVEIIMPKFGFTLETSEIVQWLKREGDPVREGEPICEVTTDKVNMEVEAPATGTLHKLLVQPGDVVEVTAIIAYMLRPGEEPPVSLPDGAVGSVSVTRTTTHVTTDAEPTDPSGVTATPVARRVAQSHQIDISQIAGTGPRNRIVSHDVLSAISHRPPHPLQPDGKVAATPAARRIANAAGIDLRAVAGTGPDGRVQGTDVQAYLDQQPRQAATQPVTDDGSSPDGEAYRAIPLQGMRRTIASRLQQSYQTAPHIFVEVQVDITELEALRVRLKARGEKLSMTAILVKACAAVLKRHPMLNATLVNDEIQQWAAANIGVAVALDEGLIVPVIHRAERLSLREVQMAVTDLSGKARENRLRLDEVSGGTFTISNMGMMGVTRFTAIINPPQVAILAVGRAMQQFLPDAAGSPVLRSTMNLTLSADHRVIDGAQAAAFLADLQTILEDPALLAW